MSWLCYSLIENFYMFDNVLWFKFLYQPLFNLLIWLYNNVTANNLGWAIVILTVLLRLILLPLTIIAERNKQKNEELMQEIAELERAYINDPITQKEEIRKLLKQKKIRPWAKATELGVQVLVLVLLYQVFVSGIEGDKVSRTLYCSVNFPGKINADFYGFHLGETHTIVGPLVVALYLLLEIYRNFSKREAKITQSDLAYFILFPFFSFVILWILPMVKSLFVLTSLVFSTFIHFLIVLFKPKNK